jgi:hypothetical protein
MTIIMACTGQRDSIHHFLYLAEEDLPKAIPLLKRPDIEGLQILYNWKTLEPSKGQFDFSAISETLAILNTRHKKFFIQVQDRFFSPEARNIPDYLLNDPTYNGGLVPQHDNAEVNKTSTNGWVTEQWNPAVRHRLQLLIQALASAFDGKIYGINLPETSAEIDTSKDTKGFTSDRYFEAEIANILFARKVFKKSFVVQYANFFPGEWNDDRHYMSRIFALAEKNKIGLGGPDIVPYKAAQMKNSYPFFHSYKGRLALVAMAVQEPTLEYINPQTGKPFTREEFVSFAGDYLGVNIIFWSLSAPWLK